MSIPVQKGTEVFSVAAVVVTFNRLVKLKHTLACYTKQILPPTYLIVVDNASTDGTGEYLDEWAQAPEGNIHKIVIHSEENLGGSGGYYLGEKRAMECPCDWVMVGDDDASPKEDYLSVLADFMHDKNAEDYSILCGKVIEHGTENHHRGFLDNALAGRFMVDVPESWMAKPSFDCEEVSYLGILFNKDKLAQVGLVNPEFFIWFDDVEHCLRLGRVGKITCVPRAELVHDSDIATNMSCSWKSYYGMRNSAYILRQYRPFYFAVYLAWMMIKAALIVPLKGKTCREAKLRFAALGDALFGRLGKHPVYKPGWKL